jgi:hypothetical protein
MRAGEIPSPGPLRYWRACKKLIHFAPIENGAHAAVWKPEKKSFLCPNHRPAASGIEAHRDEKRVASVPVGLAWLSDGCSQAFAHMTWRTQQPAATPVTPTKWTSFC